MKSTIFVAAFALSLASSCGCTSTSMRCKKDVSPLHLGMVRTEGALIKSKTLVIPPEGLTLIDVVEQCERSSPTLTHSLNRSPLADARNALVGQQNNRIGLASQELSKSLNALSRVPAGSMQSLLDATEARDTAQTKLIEELEKAEVKLLPSNKEAVEKLSSEVSAERDETKRDQLFAKFNQSFLPKSQTVANEGSDAIQISNNNSPQQLVVLSRRNGRRIIVPIELVKGWIAGDIALADGDQIGIVPKEGASAFSREGGDEKSNVTIALSGLTQRSEITTTYGSATLASFIEGGRVSDDQLEAYANIVVLQTLTPTGQMEEYILPMPEYPAFTGMKSELLQLNSSLYLQDGDHFHFGALELTPLILTSRAQNRQMQIEALQAKIHSAQQMHGIQNQTVHKNAQENAVLTNLVSCQKKVSESVNNSWQSIPRPNFRAINPLR